MRLTAICLAVLVTGSEWAASANESAGPALAVESWSAKDTQLANYYLAALQKDPTDTSTAQLLWNLYEKRRTTPTLLNYLGKQATAPGSPAAVGIIWAQVLRQAGRMEEAFAMAESVVAAPATTPAALTVAASLAQQLSKTDRAIDLLEKLSQTLEAKSPARGTALSSLGLLLLQGNQPDRAVAVWQQLATDFPAADTLKSVAIRLQQAGHPEAAAPYLEILSSSTDPETRSSALRDLARVRELTGDFPGAGEALQKGLAATHHEHPQFRRFLELLVRLHERFGRNQELERRLTASALRPELTAADLAAVVYFYELTGQEDQRVQWLEKWAARDPEHKPALARTLIECDRLPQAIALLEELLAASPNVLPLTFLRCEADLRAGKNLEASQRLKNHLSQHPNQPEKAAAILEFARQQRLADIEELVLTSRWERQRGDHTATLALARLLLETNREQRAVEILKALHAEKADVSQIRALRQFLSSLSRLDLLARLVGPQWMPPLDTAQDCQDAADYYLNQHRSLEALSALEKALPLTPDYQRRWLLEERIHALLDNVEPPRALPTPNAYAEKLATPGQNDPASPLRQAFWHLRWQLGEWPAGSLSALHVPEALRLRFDYALRASQATDATAPLTLSQWTSLTDLSQQLDLAEPQNRSEIRWRLAEEAMRRNLSGSARELLESLPRENQADPRIVALLLRLHEKGRDAQTSQKLLEDSLASSPTPAARRQILSIARESLPRLALDALAAPLHLQVIRQETDRETRLAILSDLLAWIHRRPTESQSGLHTQVTHLLRNAALTEPTESFFTEALARAEQAAGKPRESLEAMRQAYYNAGAPPEMLPALRQMALDAGDAASAMQWQRQLLTAAGAKASLKDWMDAIPWLEKDLRLEEADRLWGRLERLYGNDPAALEKLRLHYRETHQFPAERRITERLAVLRPFDAVTWLEAAQTQVQSDDLAAAAGSLRKAFSLATPPKAEGATCFPVDDLLSPESRDADATSWLVMLEPMMREEESSIIRRLPNISPYSGLLEPRTARFIRLHCLRLAVQCGAGQELSPQTEEERLWAASAHKDDAALLEILPRFDAAPGFAGHFCLAALAWRHGLARYLAAWSHGGGANESPPDLDQRQRAIQAAFVLAATRHELPAIPQEDLDAVFTQALPGGVVEETAEILADSSHAHLPLALQLVASLQRRPGGLSMGLALHAAQWAQDLGRWEDSVDLTRAAVRSGLQERPADFRWWLQDCAQAAVAWLPAGEGDAAFDALIEKAFRNPDSSGVLLRCLLWPGANEALAKSAAASLVEKSRKDGAFWGIWLGAYAGPRPLAAQAAQILTHYEAQRDFTMEPDGSWPGNYNTEARLASLLFSLPALSFSERQEALAAWMAQVSDRQALSDAAGKLERAGWLREAVAVYQELVAQEPAQGIYIDSLLRTCAAVRDDELARSTLEIHAAAGDFAGLENLGLERLVEAHAEILFRQRDLAALERCASASPFLGDGVEQPRAFSRFYLLQLVKLHGENGQEAALQAAARRALEIQPADPLVEEHLAESLMRQGKQTEARSLLEGCLLENNRTVTDRTSILLATIFMDARDWPAMLKLASTAIHWDHSGVWGELATILSQSGRPNEGSSLLSLAARRNRPSDTRFQLLLSRLELAQDRQEPFATWRETLDSLLRCPTDQGADAGGFVQWAGRLSGPSAAECSDYLSLCQTQPRSHRAMLAGVALAILPQSLAQPAGLLEHPEFDAEWASAVLDYLVSVGQWNSASWLLDGAVRRFALHQLSAQALVATWQHDKQWDRLHALTWNLARAPVPDHLPWRANLTEALAATSETAEWARLVFDSTWHKTKQIALPTEWESIIDRQTFADRYARFLAEHGPRRQLLQWLRRSPDDLGEYLPKFLTDYLKASKVSPPDEFLSSLPIAAGCRAEVKRLLSHE